MLNDYSLDPEAPVLVLGAASIDIVGRLQTDMQAGTSNPAHIRTSFGGTARNVAENLARLGHPVTLLTAVGEDQIGEQLLTHTASSGVNMDYALRTGEHPTGSYVAMIDTSGELQFALDDMRAISTISPDYLQQHESCFKESSLVFLDANLPPQTLKIALRMARRAKLPICADPTSTSLAVNFQPYLSQLFLLIPNIYEAAVYCEESAFETQGEKGVEAAKHLVSQGVDFAIVTLAELGVSYATSETSGHIRAIKTDIVDPTGGGDALCATVIFALLNDIPPDEAVRLGVSAASLTLRHPGAVDPDLSLEKLYDQLVI